MAAEADLFSLLFTFFGLIGTLATQHFENPRNEYYSAIQDIQDNRLGDVCYALGYVVSDAYSFMEKSESKSAMKLSSEEEASVAVTEAISTPDDLKTIKKELNRYFDPPKCYQRCRQSRDYSTALFIFAAIFGIIPPAVTLQYPENSTAEYTSIFSTGIAFLLFIIGVALFLLYMKKRSEIDNMTEAADFELE